MHKSLRLAAILALGCPSATLAPASPAPAAPPPTTFEQSRTAIDELFRQQQKDSNSPGLVWGIVRDGRVVHLGTSGVQDLEARRPVAADSLFRIASLTKAFTALAILKLRDEGKLSLDDLAEKHVPEMRGWRYPTEDSPRIRISDLLSHRGGLVTDDPWADRQESMTEAAFTQLLREGAPFHQAPGVTFEYSNLGYAILGRIVANVSGQSYKDFMEQRIMRPLGMTSSGLEVGEAPADRRALGYRWEDGKWIREPDTGHGAFSAIGGIQTSARDYGRYVAALLSAWPARDAPDSGPVRRASIRELATGASFPSGQVRQGADGKGCALTTSYGKGFGIGKDCELGNFLLHTGGYPGYGSAVLLLPEQGTGIFAFSNRTYANLDGALIRAALVFHKHGLLKPRQVPTSDALTSAYRTAAAIYRARDVAPGAAKFAMNFLLDRSAAARRTELARLHEQAGPCTLDAPVIAEGALSGRFSWMCERGTIEGSLSLAPTSPPSIQELDFEFVPTKPAVG